MSLLEPIIHVRLRLLQKGTGRPLFGSHLVVRLYDEDPLSDDYLGSATPNEEGEVQIDFDEGDIKSVDSPGEEMPDLYFVVLANGKEVYHSRTAEDRDPPRKQGTFSMEKGIGLDLGTYLIDA